MEKIFDIKSSFLTMYPNKIKDVSRDLFSDDRSFMMAWLSYPTFWLKLAFEKLKACFDS